MRRFRVLVVMSVVSALLVGMGITPRLTLAASIEVGSSAQYPCNRQGLTDAIQDAGSGGTVTFNCDSSEIDFYSGEQISISADITIDGSNGGGDQIVLNGNEQTRFFDVTADKFTLQHITLRDGKADSGGALRLGPYGQTEIIDTTFTSNQATVHGGAIYNPGPGRVDISQGSFTNNQAGFNGGAIYDGGFNFTVTESSFIHNQAISGGAIYNFRHSSAIVQSSFISNHAASNGGAIFIWQGPLAVASSTFSENTANRAGSAVYVSGDTTIAWSTIVQPDATTAALFIGSDLTLTGIILGGKGEHCSFYEISALYVTDTLANDDSCGRGSTEIWENQDLMLGHLATIMLNGVEQSYYGLFEGSPAIDNGPASCAFEFYMYPLNITVNTDQLDTPRPVNGACDIGAIEGLIFYPVELCANAWNGAVSMPRRGDCGRSSWMIELPADGPIGLCVNNWNGATRVAEHCSRSEHAVTAIGDHSIPICVNRWNGSLRVSERCSRSEIADAI